VSRDELIREAVRLAEESVGLGGGPFGALVALDGVIVGRGRNRVTEARDPTAHAEIEAIRDACRRIGSHQLTGCDLYASSEPCPMCLGAIYWARPQAVYFAIGRGDAARAGFDDEFIYQEIGRPPGDRRIPMQRIIVPDSDKPYRLWSAKPDREEY
jgi:guanine deaminase